MEKVLTPIAYMPVIMAQTVVAQIISSLSFLMAILVSVAY